MKAIEFRNFIPDDYSNYIADDYNNCCGGTIGADGSVDEAPEKDLGAKARSLVTGLVVLVGVVVISNWAYGKFIKK